MMPLDAALRERARETGPLRVGLVGPGFLGGLLAGQIVEHVPGLELAAIAGRTSASARAAFAAVGLDAPEVGDAGQAERILREGGRVAVGGGEVLAAAAAGLDVIVEASGDVELGARVTLDALAAGAHVVLANAELDALLGPLLARRAAAAGRTLTGIDGDEPGVAMNLLRTLRSFGLEPVMAGNLKGFFDRTRTPETQAEFAARVGVRPEMATAFADGTKLSIESAVLANATGFGVERRGMRGYRLERVEDLLAGLEASSLLERPLVDFALGAAPGSGAWVIGYGGERADRAALAYCKLGDGPLYLLYQPYHVPHLAAPLSIARAGLFGDATVVAAGLSTEVVAVAKRDLAAGELLDGIGGFCCYGEIENAVVSVREGLLPIGLARGCRLLRAIREGEPIPLADVATPAGRLVDGLLAQQRRTCLSGC